MGRAKKNHNKEKKKYLKMQHLHNLLSLMAKGRVKIDLQNENIVRSIGKALNALRNYTSFGMVENMVELISKSLEVKDLIEEEHGDETPASEEFLKFFEEHGKENLSDERFKELVSDAFVAERSSSSISSLKRQAELVKEVRERDAAASASIGILEVLKELRGHRTDLIEKKATELFGDVAGDLARLITELTRELKDKEKEIEDIFIQRIDNE